MKIFVQHDGEQYGPHSREEVGSALSKGAFLPDDLACVEGAKEWKPLIDMFPSKTKRRRFDAIRTVWRAIHDRVDRWFTPNLAIGLAVLLVLATWIYPPWVHYGRYKGTDARTPHGWFFVWDTH